MVEALEEFQRLILTEQPVTFLSVEFQMWSSTVQRKERYSFESQISLQQQSNLPQGPCYRNPTASTSKKKYKKRAELQLGNVKQGFETSPFYKTETLLHFSPSSLFHCNTRVSEVETWFRIQDSLELERSFTA